MRDLYPRYDVLSKRNTLSWNEITRRVIDRRLALDPSTHRFFSDAEWLTLQALCDRIVPQPSHRAPVPVAAMVDLKMIEDTKDGHRHAELPVMQEAWRRGIAALDVEARAARSCRFHELEPTQQDNFITAMQRGELSHPAWEGLPSRLFFRDRVLPDIVRSYYAHPAAWSEIGWGGPAGPRGYVRLQADRRDPWEAAEARPGHEADAWRENQRVGQR